MSESEQKNKQQLDDKAKAATAAKEAKAKAAASEAKAKAAASEEAKAKAAASEEAKAKAAASEEAKTKAAASEKAASEAAAAKAKSRKVSIEEDPAYQRIVAENAKLKKRGEDEGSKPSPTTPAMPDAGDSVQPLEAFYEAVYGG